MKRLAATAALVVVLGASTSVHAWWGPGWGPGWGSGWSDWWNDFFGDGMFDFDLSFSVGAGGWGRGYNRWYDYYGYAPFWGVPVGYGYPVYGYPYAVPAVAPVVPEAK